jgi:hypothetical protein
MCTPCERNQERESVNLSPIDLINSYLPISVLASTQGIGSFITFDCGNDGTALGTTWWVYLSDWKYFHNETLIATSDPPQPWTYAVGHEPTQILRVECHSFAPEIVIYMDDGKRLELSSALDEYEAVDDLIKIFLPNDVLIKYSPKYGLRSVSWSHMPD